MATLTRCALAEDPANLPMANEMVAVLHKKHAAELQQADVRKAISKVELAQSGDEGSGATLEELRAQLEHNPNPNPNPDPNPNPHPNPNPNPNPNPD